MTGVVVADAGPLIGLARIQQLGLLHRLYGLAVVPPAVHRELCLGELRPGVPPLISAFEDGWLTVEHPTPSPALHKLELLLDPGEAEAIALALQRRCRFVLLDDRRGRDAARRLNVPVAGTGAVLLAAKSAGFVPAVGPLLEDLQAARYRLAPALVAALLRRAGES